MIGSLTRDVLLTATIVGPSAPGRARTTPRSARPNTPARAARLLVLGDRETPKLGTPSSGRIAAASWAPRHPKSRGGNDDAVDNDRRQPVSRSSNARGTQWPAARRARRMGRTGAIHWTVFRLRLHPVSEPGVDVDGW